MKCIKCGKEMEVCGYIERKIKSEGWDGVACPECWSEMKTKGQWSVRAGCINMEYHINADGSYYEVKQSEINQKKKKPDAGLMDPSRIHTRALPSGYKDILGTRGFARFDSYQV
jgi:DNA-directed RNA polymerase subunit RPC12/RpoP